MTRGHRETWEHLGEADPDWAVLSAPDRRFHGWTKHLDAFYDSGAAEVDIVLARTHTKATATALDWGCGTGRLSFALAQRLRSVTSYDIASSMLALLRSRAAERQITNLLVSDVEPRETNHYDLVVSLLVIQHAPSRADALKLLRAMCDRVRRDGWLVVEIPHRASTVGARVQPRYRLYRLLRGIGVSPTLLGKTGLSGISMLTLSEAVVTRTLTDAGMRVVFVDPIQRDDDYSYNRYYAQPTG
jgi:SAM-dependent methyltransferase